MSATARTRDVRHLKARASQSGLTLEPCEDRDCSVHGDGQTDCGRLACPRCGYSGSNLVPPSLQAHASGPVACQCGNLWIAGVD